MIFIILFGLYGLAGSLVWFAVRRSGRRPGPSGAITARRFGRLHLLLLLAAALPAAITTALVGQEWKPLWLVPAGPFAGLLNWWHDFRSPSWSWSRELGAIIIGLLPWAFGGLAVALGAQWLIPPRNAAQSAVRLALWSVGWITWFLCGFWSIVAWYG